MKKIFIATAICMLTAMFSVSAFGQQALSGEWTLTRLVRDTWDVPVVASGKTPTIKFSGDGFSGNASCNSYGGSYTAAGKTFNPGPVRSTKMACVQPEINAQEKAFFDTLERATNYQVSGNTLILSGNGGAYSLTFKRNGSVEEERPFLWIVDKKKVDCRGIVHQNCLQVKKTDFAEWEILREGITGFNYRPGKYYLIRVKRTASGYKLVKVISRTRLMSHVD
jgi:heat shock protein HslJ